MFFWVSHSEEEEVVGDNENSRLEWWPGDWVVLPPGSAPQCRFRNAGMHLGVLARQISLFVFANYRGP